MEKQPENDKYGLDFEHKLRLLTAAGRWFLWMDAVA